MSLLLSSKQMSQLIKRNLSTIARTFDVMGCHSPSIVPAKLLLQAVWSLHFSWDEILSESLGIMRSVSLDSTQYPLGTLVTPPGKLEANPCMDL